MDYLVRLYDLPPEQPLPAGFALHRPLPHQAGPVLDFIAGGFSEAWADESRVAFSRMPVSLWVALREGQDPTSGLPVEGFCCYDCTFRGFLGPVGVAGSARGSGLGKALVLRCLHSMWALGYAYAIVGGVGPGGFFERVCGATAIPGSDPGPYLRRLSAFQDSVQDPPAR
ncbi:hypothetical protein JW921_06655 [Candidatus Fermentibacterales bacterium]|nr:hypothetical protein [Candidatus Fermentibacterales bacterium]